MSDAKFTPTPWQVHHEIDATGYPYFVLHGLSGKQKHDKAMLDATADLIAAAPDLLAALKEFDAAISEGGLFETAAQRHRGRKALIAARAAIARAEGRAP